MTSNALSDPSDPHAPPVDQWSSKAYAQSASFVPNLTSKILSLIINSAKPTDKVLDVGCGDGVFTEKYLPYVEEVLGVDASESFVGTANERLAKKVGGSGVDGEGTGKEKGTGRGMGVFEAKVMDCRFLERDEEVVNGSFDLAISNAALHWILSSPLTRSSTLRAIHASLKPDGIFIFEMGGRGNCSEVHTALIAALAHNTSLSIAEARDTTPWFFPDEKEMRALLEEVGFEVVSLETEWRPTPLETGEGGGLEGWVRLMGRKFLDRAEDEGGRERVDDVVREVCEVLKDIVGRKDGSERMDYVRLKGKCKR